MADVATLTRAIRPLWPRSIRASRPRVRARSARCGRRHLRLARTNVRLLEIFGNVAAVLCAIGVYGVAAFATRARRRELAIRAALGAGRRDLMFTLFSAEWRAVMVGLGLGFVLAFLAAPALFGGAFDVKSSSRHDIFRRRSCAGGRCRRCNLLSCQSRWQCEPRRYPSRIGVNSRASCSTVGEHESTHAPERNSD